MNTLVRGWPWPAYGEGHGKNLKLQICWPLKLFGPLYAVHIFQHFQKARLFLFLAISFILPAKYIYIFVIPISPSLFLQEERYREHLHLFGKACQDKVC